MPFDFSNFRSDINRTMAGDVPLVLRSRLKGVIMKRPRQDQQQQFPSTGSISQPDQQQQSQSQPQQQQQDSPMHKKSAAKVNGVERKSAFEETDEEDVNKGEKLNDESVFIGTLGEFWRCSAPLPWSILLIGVSAIL